MQWMYLAMLSLSTSCVWTNETILPYGGTNYISGSILATNPVAYSQKEQCRGGYLYHSLYGNMFVSWICWPFVFWFCFSLKSWSGEDNPLATDIIETNSLKPCCLFDDIRCSSFCVCSNNCYLCLVNRIVTLFQNIRKFMYSEQLCSL